MFLTGKTLFKSGTDGYHTYRIPALVVSTKGTILAFCEGRGYSRADHGDIEIVLKRSTDGGESWSEMKMLWDDGENTIGNPCPVVDHDTGKIFLPFTWNNEKVFVMESSDDGETWSEPREITSAVKDPSWGWYATGPTHGIQLRSGRLLVPCDHRRGPERRYPTFSHIIYSYNHGKTWEIGGSAQEKTNECVAVETVDGSIYLNMRSYHGQNRRAYAWSTDRGESWSETKLDPTLVEPVCQASAVRLTEELTSDRNRSLQLPEPPLRPPSSNHRAYAYVSPVLRGSAS